MRVEMEKHLATTRALTLQRTNVMAKSQEAHKTGGGIGGKDKRASSDAKKTRRAANLAQRADDNRSRQKGSHQAPKAAKK